MLRPLLDNPELTDPLPEPAAIAAAEPTPGAASAVAPALAPALAPAASPVLAPAKDAPLSQWLEWLETIHPVSIDMGLDRVSRVADRLKLRPVEKPLVLIGGTNGKGSTVAMLSSIYTSAGYRVGAYTSPHIHDFRERIRLNGKMAEGGDIVEALAFVEAQRAPQTLTYFEYTTLAAMRVFQQANCDIFLFEVGLGGRLDATNIWDADCSVITSIALDHEDYLGSDVSVIATEKAAIGRTGKLLIVGEPDPPDSLFAFVQEHGIDIEHVGAHKLERLPNTTMTGLHQRRNAGCAMQVVRTLQQLLPIDEQNAELSLMNVQLDARFEQVEAGGVSVVMDVAHNPAAAASLVDAWRLQFGTRRAQLIFAALADKDIAGIVAQLQPIVAHWHCVELSVSRACSADAIAEQIRALGISAVTAHPDVSSAWQFARAAASENGDEKTGKNTDEVADEKVGQLTKKSDVSAGNIVLVTGSFHTVAEVRSVVFDARTI